MSDFLVKVGFGLVLFLLLGQFDLMYLVDQFMWLLNQAIAGLQHQYPQYASLVSPVLCSFFAIVILVFAWRD